MLNRCPHCGFSNCEREKCIKESKFVIEEAITYAWVKNPSQEEIQGYKSEEIRLGMAAGKLFRKWFPNPK